LEKEEGQGVKERAREIPLLQLRMLLRAPPFLPWLLSVVVASPFGPVPRGMLYTGGSRTATQHKQRSRSASERERESFPSP
jgi:hypothetical protein